MVEEVLAATAAAIAASGSSSARHGARRSGLDAQVDCTLGGAGHATEILKASIGINHVIGFDPDGEAIHASKRKFSQNFSGAASRVWHQLPKGGLRLDRNDTTHDGIQQIDMIHGSYEFVLPSLISLWQSQGGAAFSGVASVLLDAGVSSHQLDAPHKGFTYKQHNHTMSLDMRFASPLPSTADCKQTKFPACAPRLTAYDVVNSWSSMRIAKVLQDYGDIRPQVAQAMSVQIVNARREAPICSSAELASHMTQAVEEHTAPGAAVAKLIGPAMAAIRIVVNSELAVLRSTLSVLPLLLLPGGVVTVLTFQPAERAAVQQLWKPLVKRGGFRWLHGFGGKYGLAPSSAECTDNPRAKPTMLFALQRAPG